MMKLVRLKKSLSTSRQASTKEWINIHKPLFGAFVETKIQPANTGRILRAIPAGWNYFGNFEHHNTGRVIVVWDPSVSLMIYKSSAQLITCGIYIQAHNITLTVSFAYGFNEPEDRIQLWEELSWLNSNTPVHSHPWAVIGDFNQILRLSHHSDHLSQDVDTTGMADFNLALQDAELFEAQAKGLPFTWWNNQEANPTAKKIDHALINHSWSSLFPDSYADFLEAMHSDHAACLIQMPSVVRSTRKPFKFFQHVVDHPEYKDSILQAWKPHEIEGSCQFKLVRSLRLIKPVLRSLNKNHFSGISERVQEQADKVASLQSEVLTSPTESVIREEHIARSHWNFLLSAEEKFFRQKSRVTWMHLGDKNTAFFHKSVIQREARNHIHFLRDEDDRKITTASEIKAHAADYFEGIIGCTNMPLSPASHSSLQNLLPFRCSEGQCAELQKMVTDQEIKDAVFAMPLNKSPGPDGFSLEFFRASWETVGNDVINAVREFFVNGRLLKDFNNTAIALIPKQPEACKLGDYRPISCCNLIYKVVSKIIALRLKPLLQNCISPNQAAFLKGRSLGENVLLASELIRNYQKANCPKSCMLKLDIRKAFDTVCWDFVLKMLQAQKFPPLFCTWIKECISTPRFSISVNGELAGFFPGQKGLRQGDPLSPYLFIMVMEVLSKLLSNAVAQRKIRLHPSCEDPCITHLLFADDLLIFSDGSRHSLSGIAEVMQYFKSICGLDVNPAKSELFFGGYSDIQVAVLSDLQGIRPGTFPTRYLGLPLNPKRISFATLQPFLEKITSKLHSWTSRFLSFAGKIRLISSVVYGMVNFWSAVFNLPKRFYAKVDSLCAAFLWKNKVTNATGSRVSWQDVCKPKEEGGLGIRLLEEFATVFQLKLIWNIFASAGSLWVAWLKKNMFQNKNYWTLEDSPRLSGTLRKLLQLKPTILQFLKCEVRDGHSASFWFDNWTELGQLMEFIGPNGPRQLRIRREGLVADAVRNGEWQMPGARSETQQELMIKLTAIPPPNDSNGHDIYLWKRMAGSFADSFSSKETWEQLRIHSPTVPWHKVVWFKEAVPRYSFITWLAMRGRLPTRDRLRNWGMNVPAACILCTSGMETHDHLFFECSFTAEIWRSFASRIMNQPPDTLSSITTWLLQIGGQTQYHQETTLLKLVLQASCYIVWRERNARIFTATSSSAQVLQATMDRSLRDRLLSIPASNSRSLSLLALYFGCISFPL